MSLVHHWKIGHWPGLRERIVADFRDFRFTWGGFWRWTLIVLAAFLLAALVTLYFLDWNQLRGPIGRYASARYGRPIRIEGNLKVDLFRRQPDISVDGLVIGNPSWVKRPQAARVEHAQIEFRLVPALFGHLILPLVAVDRPDILLVRDAAGRTNWQSDAQGPAAAWHIPPIRNFVIRDGHVEIDDAVRKLKFLGTITSQEEGGGRAAFLLNGDGTLNGNKFTADVHGGPLLHVDISKPYAFNADIQAGPTHAVISGSIDHPFHLDQFTARAEFSGRNLGDLYYLTGLALPGTPPFRVSGELRRDGAVYRFTGINGVVGRSDLHGFLTVDVSGKVPDLGGSLSSSVLDFDDLGALFRGGRAPQADPWLLPDVTLHTEKLRQVNAEVDYRADTIKSRDFPLRGLVTHIGVENGVLNLKPLSFAFTQGKLSGALSIDARKSVPVTGVDARITDIHVEHFIKGTDKPVAGMLEARAKLSGSGSSVHKVAASANGIATFVVPSGRIRASLAAWLGVDLLDAVGLSLSGSDSSTNLRCAVADFSVKDGRMNTQHFVFDTEPVRVDGQGWIDLKNETLALTLQGKPKSFQLLRLKAPVTVTGKLASPHIGVNTTPALTQGAIGLGLGVINPLAALLAFVDPGLNKDANCVSALSQARSEGAPVKPSALRHAAAQDAAKAHK